MKVTVLGKKNTQYVQKATGEVKKIRELHVLCDPPIHPKDGFEGCEVKVVWCPFDINDIKIGQKYDFVYEVRTGRNGDYAALVDIVPEADN